MAGLAVPSTADVMGKTIRLQSSKKTSTCSEDTLIFLGVSAFFFWWGRGAGGAVFVVIDNKQKIDGHQNLQSVYTIIYCGIKSLLQLNIANLDATLSFVFVLISRFCKWGVLIGQHFCQAFSQKTK